MPRWSRRALVAVALLALAAGCGQEDARGRVAFSPVEVQAYLEREVARTLPGLEVGAASCPPDLPDQVGATATCTVMVGRDTVRYDVQLLVGGRFEARPPQPIVVVRDIVTAVRAKLSAPEAQVSCDGAVVLQPAPDRPVVCAVTGTDPPRTAAIQVDPDGTITVTDA